MDTLGKFKTNFLKDRSSFKIGFNNRSPLSQYKSTMQTSFNIPKLGSMVGKDGRSILVPDIQPTLDAQAKVADAIGKAGKKVGQAIEKKQKLKEIEKKEADIKRQQEIANRDPDFRYNEDGKKMYKLGSLAHKTADYDNYTNYMQAKGEAQLKADGVEFDESGRVDLNKILSTTSSGVNPYGFDIPGANILDE
ncbi:MAG: hypothetical protein HRT87_08330 [Legionellales bacterium]|nr:hypothetical protein [Legionellales bacterium]